MQFTIKTRARGARQTQEINLDFEHMPPPTGFSVDAWGGLVWLTPSIQSLPKTVTLMDGRYIQHNNVILFRRSDTMTRVQVYVGSDASLGAAVEWLEGFRRAALLTVDQFHEQEFARSGLAEGDDMDDFAL